MYEYPSNSRSHEEQRRAWALELAASTFGSRAVSSDVVASARRFEEYLKTGGELSNGPLIGVQIQSKPQSDAACDSGRAFERAIEETMKVMKRKGSLPR
ncbi:hypothetical protein BJP40_06445 [Streptomyces sp. CC53]|uniref:hypothetical protein n=1 Tax=Streptomyces sp. CC53 TaxID=1906740 RepID=UPI0008DD1A86|nr:hypothetical protein [Streptomyces sp. CC53]OII61162.1 hypothetical protein BJP40_06445 [Streptomyces sp. CC53]